MSRRSWGATPLEQGPRDLCQLLLLVAVLRTGECDRATISRVGPPAFRSKGKCFLERYPTGSEEEARASQLSTMRDEADGTFGTGLWHRPRPEAAPACIISCTSPPLVRARLLNWRAAHGDEIAHAFDTPSPAWTEVDHALADAMVVYRANFAKNGNPKGPGLPVWQAIQTAARDQMMILGPKVGAGQMLDSGLVTLFDFVAIRRSVAPAR